MRRGLVLAVSLAVLAAACGGHDDTESAEQDDASSTVTQPAGTGGTVDAGRFGTMAEPVCGPGDASGATDQGVTDDAIEVGTISDPGNTILPGLLQELFDASEAFVAWCNAAGGINGRPIELTLHDTKFIEGQQVIAEACAEDFFLVGGGSGVDATLAQPRVDCGLPQIPAFLNDPVAQAADLQIQSINPFYPGYQDVSLYRLAAEQYPDEIDSFAYLIPDLPTSGTPLQETLLPLLEDELGYTVVYQNTTPAPPATVDNWRPYVEPAEEAGAGLFEFRSSPEQMVPLMAAMGDIGYSPEAILLQGNNYDAKLIEGNDLLADIPTYVGLATYPFEEAADNPPTQQFLELMDAQVPGWSEKPAQLAAFSWSAWLLFAQAAKACGSELTRQCVLDEAAAVSEFDGGGMHAPVDPDPDEPRSPQCIVVVRATPDGFVLDEAFTRPNTGVYNCDDANRVAVPG
ncbi:MAG: ABC transporter substrate-binding protein [Acidimicrobiales bacterium]|jgi:ABC-type branched-subunit amino acid transport system substrate-binding protein|nr:ABC transporter substrate-binding protein [Acidimicrobiales bacterium]